MKLDLLASEYGPRQWRSIWHAPCHQLHRYDYWSGRGRTAFAGAVNVETARRVTEFAHYYLHNGAGYAAG